MRETALGFPGPWVLLVLLPFLAVFCLVPFLLLGLKVIVSFGLLEIQGLLSMGVDFDLDHTVGFSNM